MLTRLRVSGFKNLVDVDVRLGPFTCVVGPNGAGKSNLFDAIRFLSALSNNTLMEAASAVRDQHSRTTQVSDLFQHVGNRYADCMSFVADMVVPQRAVDDLGQEAKASTTFLRYSPRHLLFPHSAKHWRKSIVHGRRAVPFISTESEGENRVIKLHQDGGSSGRPLRRPAVNLPRTVLSVATAAESPTVLVARREMESWQLLQLEPSALRKPDEFGSPTRLGPDGSHLAATLHRLARNAEQRPSKACTNIAATGSRIPAQHASSIQCVVHGAQPAQHRGGHLVLAQPLLADPLPQAIAAALVEPVVTLKRRACGSTPPPASLAQVPRVWGGTSTSLPVNCLVRKSVCAATTSASG